MSELTRLRERWVRLERQIAKLEADCEIAFNEEVPGIVEKIQVVKECLNATIAATHAEELRLLHPDTKLIFKIKPKKDRAPHKTKAVVSGA